MAGRARPPTDTALAGRERRRAPRVLVDLEVDWGNRENFLFASITDLSATGIFVQTNVPEPAGTQLNLRFTAAGADAPLELEGTVIWINPYRPGHADNLNPGMGIRFTTLSTEQRHRLVALIKTFAYLDDDE